MQDRQYAIGETIEGHLERRVTRLTRQTDRTALSLFSAYSFTNYREAYFPWAINSHTNELLVAMQELDHLPDLKHFSVHFTARVAAALPATLRFLSFDKRTTYVLDNFRITSSECSDLPARSGPAIENLSIRLSRRSLHRHAAD
jgi:hypothetical protein